MPIDEDVTLLKLLIKEPNFSNLRLHQAHLVTDLLTLLKTVPLKTAHVWLIFIFDILLT